MLPFIVCPATCELCGDWLPEHKVKGFFVLFKEKDVNI